MVGAFGEKFRTERERRGFTLDDVSNVTKISPRMLKAIEEEHFDQLPGGVFNKGFIRAYAKHLGFNDEESVSEYLLALRQAQIDAQTVAWQPENFSQGRVPLPSKSVQPRPQSVEARQPAPAAVPSAGIQSKDAESGPAVSVSAKTDRRSQVIQTKPEAAPASPKMEDSQANHQEPAASQPSATSEESTGAVAASASAMAWKIAALVLAIAVLAVALWNRRTHGAGAEGNNSPLPAAQNSTPSASPASTNGSSPAAAAGAPASSPSPSQSSQTARPPSLSSSSPSSLPATEKPIDASEKAGASPSSVPAIRPAAKPATPPPALTLAIRASENCWISVTADGQTVGQETLIAPAHTSVRASHEIVVKVGNAAAVSFLLNGKEFPALGGSSEVKTFVFDNTGMRVAATTPQPDLPH